MNASRWIIGCIFIVDWCLLTYLALALAPSPGHSGIPHFDKLLHFIAYFQLSALAFLLMPNQKLFLRLCALIIVYGAVIEFLQSFVPGREMSVLDFVANTIGVIFLVWLCKIYLAKKAAGSSVR